MHSLCFLTTQHQLHTTLELPSLCDIVITFEQGNCFVITFLFNSSFNIST